MISSILSSPVTLTQLLVILGCSIVMGVLTALVFSYRGKSSSSFSLTLAILPAAMAAIVLLVNGNLGIAVAVAGGFTLVRFRSIAGTGREISAIFVVMTLGVMLGMGYIFLALGFFVIMNALVLLLTKIRFCGKENEKRLRITIPEDYDYYGLFDDIFAKYSAKAELERIKTVNMGSLIDVTYRLRLPGETLPKPMLDELRARNANLSIVVMSCETDRDQL